MCRGQTLITKSTIESSVRPKKIVFLGQTTERLRCVMIVAGSGRAALRLHGEFDVHPDFEGAPMAAGGFGWYSFNRGESADGR